MEPTSDNLCVGHTVRPSLIDGPYSALLDVLTRPAECALISSCRQHSVRVFPDRSGVPTKRKQFPLGTRHQLMLSFESQPSGTPGTYVARCSLNVGEQQNIGTIDVSFENDSVVSVRHTLLGGALLAALFPDRRTSTGEWIQGRHTLRLVDQPREIPLVDIVTEARAAYVQLTGNPRWMKLPFPAVSPEPIGASGQWQITFADSAGPGYVAELRDPWGRERTSHFGTIRIDPTPNLSDLATVTTSFDLEIGARVLRGLLGGV